VEGGAVGAEFDVHGACGGVVRDGAVGSHFVGLDEA